MYNVNVCDYNIQGYDYGHIYRPEGTEDYLLLFFRTPMKVIQGDMETITKENAFILYNIGTPQDYQAIKVFKNSFVHFTVDKKDFNEKYKIPFDKIFYVSDISPLNDLFKQIGYEFSLRHYLYEEKIDTLMVQLFIELSRQLILVEDTSWGDSDLVIQFYRARFYMLANIEYDWSSEEIASLTNFGSSQFYHYYKKLFNRSPKSELIEARIEKAKELLKTTDNSVNEIAGMCGFKNQAYFTRYFKSKCGMPPSEFALINKR